MKLKKTFSRTFIPGSPGSPGLPGRPYIPPTYVTIPARTEVRTTVDYAMLMAMGAYYQDFPNPVYDGNSHTIHTPPLATEIATIPVLMFQGRPFSPVVGGIFSTRDGKKFFVPVITTRQYIPEQMVLVSNGQSYVPPTPAIPAVPSQSIISNNPGWNARAHSKRSFPDYGVAEIVVPDSAVGVIAGLNDEPQSSGYADIRFAFYVSKGDIWVMESGMKVFYVGRNPTEMALRIKRYQGKISYIFGDTVVREVDNTSVPLFLDAALYLAGDTVEGWIDPMHGVEVEFPPMVMSGGEGSPKDGGNIAFMPMRVAGRVRTYSIINFAPMKVQGSDRVYGAGSVRFEPMNVKAEIGLISISFGSATIISSPMSMNGHGLSGTVGTGNVAFKEMKVRGSEGNRGDGDVVLPLIRVFGAAFEGNNNAAIFSYAGTDTPLSASAALYITFNSSGTISSVFAANITIPADMKSIGQAGFAWALQATINAAMLSVATGASVAPLSDEQQSVWVVNLENQGTTRYENYPFNSFAKIGDAYYGAAADGIYRLDGATDAGLPVQAMLSLGKQTFGGSEKKSVPNCYVGLSSGGKLYLKVVSEGQEYIYAARASGTNLKQQRFDLGRGFHSNYLEFELYNKDGDDFELDSVEFLVATLSRRI